MVLCWLLLLLPLGQAQLDTKFQSHLFFPTHVNLAVWEEKKARSTEVDIIHCGWHCMDLQVASQLSPFGNQYSRVLESAFQIPHFHILDVPFQMLRFLDKNKG